MASISRRLFCRRCKVHGKNVPVKGHAPICPFNDCNCQNCNALMELRATAIIRRYQKRNMDEDLVVRPVKFENGNIRFRVYPKRLDDAYCLLPTTQDQDNTTIQTTTHPTSIVSPRNSEEEQILTRPNLPVLEQKSDTEIFRPVPKYIHVVGERATRTYSSIPTSSMLSTIHAPPAAQLSELIQSIHTGPLAYLPTIPEIPLFLTPNLSAFNDSTQYSSNLITPFLSSSYFMEHPE